MRQNIQWNVVKICPLKSLSLLPQRRIDQNEKNFERRIWDRMESFAFYTYYFAILI